MRHASGRWAPLPECLDSSERGGTDLDSFSAAYLQQIRLLRCSPAIDGGGAESSKKSRLETERGEVALIDSMNFHLAI